MNARLHRVVAGALPAAVLAACATPPPPKLARTTVVLMPDEDGNVGAVSVSNDAGSQRIDQAYHFATVEAPTAARRG